MSVISIPYALANNNMTKFKEISAYEYQTIVRAIDTIYNITQEKYHSIHHPAGSAAIKHNQLKKEFKPLTQQYNVALSKLNEFKKRHYNVLSKGELIMDDEYPMPFSSIFTNVTREQLLEKHKAKHKAIYSQLQSLYAEVLRLQPYAPEQVERTIAIHTSNLKSHIESQERADIEKWEKDKQERLTKQNKILSQYKAHYGYVIQDLKIYANPPEYKISCVRRVMNSIFKTENQRFAQTFINPTLEIQH